MFASVIIPVYNDEEYVGRLLDSLAKQTVKNFETIVIDDKSADKTGEIVNRYRKKLKLKILTSGKHNQSYSRNLGIKIAKGDVLINLDSDCHVNETFVEGVIEAFKNDDIEGLRVGERFAMDFLLERVDQLRTMSKYGGYAQTVRVFKKGYSYDDDLVCFGDDFVIHRKIKGKIGYTKRSMIFSHRFHSWADIVKSWKRYPSGFVYYRKYDNVLKGFIPLFFPFVSPFIAIHRLIKFRDPAALLIPVYDTVRSAAYLYGMITNPMQIIKGSK
ncbi:MAG: glycosyltransferase family 2 protein [Candidatus Aenigmarchaeota archaeon]|nr:glycosyltransferase family 2 protein [Candidatus Aenigmarchaeota archaeon]